MKANSLLIAMLASALISFSALAQTAVKDAAEKTGSAVKTAATKTADGAKTVGSKTADGAKTVANKTEEGVKTGAEKTADASKSVAHKVAKTFNPVTDKDIADAKAKNMVWANTSTKVYHTDGEYYGHTKEGKFMTKEDAEKAGFRAAKEPVAKKKS